MALSIYVVLLSTPIAVKAQAPDFQQIDRSVVDVQVTCPYRADDDGLSECSGRATGVVISERQGMVRIITALHEVHGVNSDPQAKITVRFAFDQLNPVTAKLLGVSNSQLDVAVLEADLPRGVVGTGTMPLSWAHRSAMQKNIQLWTIDGLWNQVQGSLVDVVHDQAGDRLRYITQAGNGYSGGPVLDLRGEVVGIHLRSRAEIEPNMRDGVLLETVIAWLRSLGYTDEATNRLTEASSERLGAATKEQVDLSKLRPLSEGDRGTLLFRAGHYVEALPLLSRSALQGDGHAAAIVSGMYLAGQGVVPNIQVANQWAMRGALAGNDVCMNILAASSVAGYGVQQDLVKGAYWYRKSADMNNAQGMTGLALVFANGQVNAQANAPRTPERQALDTDVQAVYWYRRASQSGDLLARAMLGLMYANGRGGLPVDYGQAIRLYQSTANQGSSIGMRMLGDMYSAGRVNGARNFPQAVYWYRKAASLGDRIAKERLRKIAEANPGQRF